MSRMSALSATVALAILAGLGAATSVQAADGLSCELKVAKRGGAKILEAFVMASSPVAGSYRISATPMTGGADIDQSGAFSAKPGGSVSLGSMALASAATRYSAVLTVKGIDGTVACTAGADAN
jgi:hypothetical protein